MFDDRTEIVLNKKQEKSISKRFEKYNLFVGTAIASTQDIEEHGNKVGREIAKSVLEDFPSFPENTGLKDSKVYIFPTFKEDSTPKEVFYNYCYWQWFESEIGQKALGNGYNMLKVWSVFQIEMQRAVTAVWDENLLNADLECKM